MNASIIFAFVLGCLHVDDLLVASLAENNTSVYCKEQPSVATSDGSFQEILQYSHNNCKISPRSGADAFVNRRG